MVISITFDIKLSNLKMMLIEQQDIKVTFQFPDLLLNTITEAISQQEVHEYAQTVFGAVRKGISTQLISFKKFSNCFLVTTKVRKAEH